MAKLVDLGHRLYDGMPAYPGLPAARVTELLSHEASRDRYAHRAEFALTRTDLAGNTGTYLDSPWHRHRDGTDIGGIPLEHVADLPGIVIDVSLGNPARGIDIVADLAPAVDGALLVRTGWSKRWGAPNYFHYGPFLSEASIGRIVAVAPRVVGVDFSNVDNPADPERPAHTRLLGAGILIVEHLADLEALPSAGFRFHCAPLRVTGAASIPVRPYAVVEDLERSRPARGRR